MKILTLITLVLLSSLAAHAQGKPEAAPAMKTEDQLRIRNLQHEQDKKLLEMKSIEARYRELVQGVEADGTHLNDIIRAAGVDLTKFVFDLDTLRFVPRPQPKPSEVKPK